MRKEILNFAEENLRKMVANLPDIDRKIILSCYLEELKYDEIMESFHIGKKIVQNTISRFRERILGKEGMFQVSFRLFEAHRDLCEEYRKAQKRQKRKQKK